MATTQIRRSIICVAGPIGTDPDGPEAALGKFVSAEAALKAAGYVVQNTTEGLSMANGIPDREALQLQLRKSIRALTTAGALALLPGWQQSPRAALEVYIATNLGVECQPVAVWVRRAQS